MEDKTNNKDDNRNVELPPLPEGKVAYALYFTDPICCYCWQAEPILRKLELLYGDKLEFKTYFGGLLPDWEGFEDAANDIKATSDVADHWREAAKAFGMPTDGSIMDENPVKSSYPPSKVVKLVQQISNSSAKRVLRFLREELFVFNRNIAQDDVLEDVLNRLNRNGAKIVADSKEPLAQELLNQDLDVAQRLDGTTFPTILFIDESGRGLRLTGMQTFETYEAALQELLGDIEPQALPKLEDLFDYSHNLFFKEIEEIYGLNSEEVIPFITHNLPENSYDIRQVPGGDFLTRR